MSHILKVIAQRIALGFLTLFTISLLITFGVELLPGDLAESILGQGATPETVKVFRTELGLDKPAHMRYLSWLGGIVTGDLGVSLANKREISELVGIRIANTLFLGGFAATIAVPLALFLGILAALYRNTLYDRAINTFTLTTISFPEFFVAYILILFFAIKLGWFPGISNISTELSFGNKLYRTLLPATTLTLVVLAHMLRMTRATIINLLASPYIEMARLKGISPMKIILRHALPNALAPIVNVVAINLAYLVVGVVIVEVVFVYPGLGQLMVD
ncbi:MAG: ABC transporter permease, partial [SAR324 cluster bacterium]|nr:ABC transporter permease [SAR324 cluster bacterium]